MPQIKVHEKALAHLSRGLYRSPASALRELVSNAWDANARVVRINTNYPSFFQLSVSDNGDGFTRELFESLMGGGIGNSEKREEDLALINGRPVIGRLGIGLLGIAQICGGFSVTSKTKDGAGFRAYVRLFDLLKEKLDRDDTSVIKELEVKPKGVDQNDSGTEEYEIRDVLIGEYSFDTKFDPKTTSRGTTILADDVHPTFVQTFKESLSKEKFPKFKPSPSEWSKALKILGKVHSLQELGDYWRLLWELSAACPIPYVSDKAVPGRLIADDHERLRGYDFKVLVDGLELLKPIQLRGNPGGYTTKKLDVQSKIIYGKHLTFHGYLLVQESKQLLPDELRGILVRIKNIGIGYYDPSMLDYRFNEGPRAKWLTGEIYVDQGLEDALNIDRDSFNRFHPQFRALQTYIHEVLHNDVFPEVYRNIDIRSKAKAEARDAERVDGLRAIIAATLETPVRIKQKSASDNDDEFPEVELVEKQSVTEVLVPAPDELETKKPYRQLASALLAIYEIAMREKARDKQRRVFTDLLLKLLSGW